MPYVKNVMNITGGIARVTYQFQGNVYDSNYKIYGTFSADPTDNQANLLLKALVEAWETNNFKLVKQLISKEIDPASVAELVKPIIPDKPKKLFTRVSRDRKVVPKVVEYTRWEKILIRLFPNREAQINDAKRARMRAAQEYTTKPRKLVPTDIPIATGKPGGPSADTSDLATEGALDHANEAPKGPTLGL